MLASMLSTQGLSSTSRTECIKAGRIHVVLHKIIGCSMKLLAHRGGLIEEQGSTYLADSDADSDDVQTLRPPRVPAACLRPACRAEGVDGSRRHAR